MKNAKEMIIVNFLDWFWGKIGALFDKIEHIVYGQYEEIDGILWCIRKGKIPYCITFCNICGKSIKSYLYARNLVCKKCIKKLKKKTGKYNDRKEKKEKNTQIKKKNSLCNIR